MEERWVPVVGYEQYYEVSDQGRVKSLRTGRIMRPSKVNAVGHLQLTLSGGGPQRSKYVHRLVLEAFVGPCPDGMECCHNDGDASNNHLSNLRWDTSSNNNYDKVKHGTHHHANRTHCPKGHPLDAVKYTADGRFKQRRCRTCLREQNRAKKARKMTCPQGHPFDGIAYKSDGSMRQRYCTKCRSESVSRQMTERHAANPKTHCKYGHELDGECKGRNGKTRRYCKTCLRESSRKNHEKKKLAT